MVYRGVIATAWPGAYQGWVGQGGYRCTQTYKDYAGIWLFCAWLGTPDWDILAGHPWLGHPYGKSVTERGHVAEPGYGPYVSINEDGAAPRRAFWP